jgi:hypothetical protein
MSIETEKERLHDFLVEQTPAHEANKQRAQGAPLLGRRPGRRHT